MAVTKRAAIPVSFRYGDDDADEPEIKLAGISPVRSIQAAEVVQGMDLSGRPKIVLLAGRGKTGKTTAARWLVDRAVEAGRDMAMGDLDPTNATFTSWFEDVSRPPNMDHAAGAVKWLEQFIDFSLRKGSTALVDLGGGDATLRGLVNDMPNLVDTVHSAGSALVMLYFLGPQVDDLSPVAAMEERGFQPPATALVMNEASIEPMLDRETGFARVRKHSMYRSTIARGAVPVWMPRLQNAELIERKRLAFSSAARDGAVKDGVASIGLFERARVSNWLTAIEAQFSGIASWLP